MSGERSDYLDLQLNSLLDMREKFKEIQKRYSSIPRTPYIYPTTVTVSLMWIFTILV